MTDKQPKCWWVYMIECANGHLYTGCTNDVERRFNEHQANGAKTAKFLRGKGPLKLVYREYVGSQGDALRREVVIKKMKRKNKLILCTLG
ncbi:GIY-YIG nuclease family protein [Parashewanella spongiae]|uniref:GIY-YIG nuclease family protein n=1 Tax=Parashewanella spongiae TaxID=342950 RepID=A0A3A6TBH0_9GAMM|nr:GIY-YIG nuclease family protein [Parashewanella spongiae]RJY06763.1 GIY-YIG nuclease family protein [Parashewanella spongiae]